MSLCLVALFGALAEAVTLTASISPDGKTLLAVGDTNEVFLYNLVAGDSVEFNRISKYRGGSPGAQLDVTLIL